MPEITITKLDENIYIYKGLIPNNKKIVDLLKESESNKGSSFLFDDWQPWSRFGSYVYAISQPLNENDENAKTQLYLDEKEALDTILNAFYYATSNFMSSHELSIGEDWVRMGPSISKYTHDNNPHLSEDSLEMMYHTDYKVFEADSPGNKFALTCTMYLNDDYRDGGLSFLTGDKRTIDYKPVAGDVLVFPSGHPDLLSQEGRYLHAVKRIRDIDKYLVRCFYQIPFDGTQEWHANQERFGAEEWAKMEKERIENNRRYHDFQNKEEKQENSEKM
jgi:hypothetical protein